jgi:hypothetical protein
LSDFIKSHKCVIGNDQDLRANKAWQAADPSVHQRGIDDTANNNGPVLWYKRFKGYPTAELLNVPKVTTETGWPSVGGLTPGIPEDAQAKVYLNVYLSQFARGFKHTFIYEMKDGQGSPGLTFGLFRNDNTPKPAAHFVHNLTSILVDLSKRATLGLLNYSVSGAPATFHDLLLQHSDGRFYLILWNERIPNDGGADDVTVDLGQAFPRVNLYDPTLGTGIQKAYGNVRVLPLTMKDHPVILELK